jgi:hypothetical protein
MGIESRHLRTRFSTTVLAAPGMNGSDPGLWKEYPHGVCDEQTTRGSTGDGGRRVVERVRRCRRDALEPALQVSGSGFIGDLPVALAVAHWVTAGRCIACARVSRRDSRGASGL